MLLRLVSYPDRPVYASIIPVNGLRTGITARATLVTDLNESKELSQMEGELSKSMALAAHCTWHC